MTTRKFLSTAVLACVAAGLLTFAPARPPTLEPVLAGREMLAPGQPFVPAYRFEVGQELVYRTRGERQEGDSVIGTLDRMVRLLVVNESPGGNWRLVLFVTESEQRFPTGQEAPARTMLAYADVGPDGRYERNRTLKAQDVAALLTPLPTGAREAARGWTAPDPSGYAVMEFSAVGMAPFDDHLLVLRQLETGLRTRVLEAEFGATVLFDTALGLLVHKELVSREGSHAAGRWVMTTVLDTIRELDAEELDRFATETGVWFAAFAEWDSLTDRAEMEPGRAAELCAAADSALARARAGLTLPELVGHADSEIAWRQRVTGRLLAAGREEDALIGEPAPGWELTDLDGQTYRLADYRGRVVVLDFWYRRCGWCIRALPQVEELARRYRDRAVAVFGVYVDDDPDDARFAARELELSYPTLMSRQTDQDYRLAGFPAVVVVDREGRVAHIHRGYSQEMVAELAAVLDRALGD
ncbi:MAG: TlpA disulfide reductase family protein [bacterium]